MDFVASSAALRVVEQPSEIKGTCSSAVLTLWFLSTVNCRFCVSVLLLAGLHAGLDQTRFSVNDSWQIQDDGTPRNPLQSPDKTETETEWNCWNLQLERGNQLQFTSTDQMSTWNKPVWVQIDEKFLQSGFSQQHTHASDDRLHRPCRRVKCSLLLLAATSKPVSSV